jgi:DNA recombination protein RmuC
LSRKYIAEIARLQHIADGSAALSIENGRLTRENQELHTRVGVLTSQLEMLDMSFKEQRFIIDNTLQGYKNEFKNLATEILENRAKNLNETSEKNIRTLLDPLSKEIKEFKEKVENTYQMEARERHSLKNEITRIVETSTKIGLQADNLATALKGNVKQQGNWGEMILESILQNSGLTKDREYFLQQFIRDNAGNIIKDANGNGLQPDVTILYPDNRKVIIDSKVSLVAWEQYVNENDAIVQKKALNDHITSMKAHIDSLSRKNYPKYAKAIDYVLMFVPIEPAFLEALKSDTGLWKYAYDRNVVLVSPTNLLAVLKIVADMWKMELQNRHAIEVADKAGELYDKLCNFISSMEDIGNSLKKGIESYDKAIGQLSKGPGNALRKAEELKGMGANAKKQLPDKYINKDGE